MEAIIKLLKEFSDLLQTRFKEMVIIALCYIVYVQHGDNKQLTEQVLLEKEKSKQDQINVFREVMNKTDKLMDKTSEIVQKTDTIITRNNYGEN